MITGIIVYIVVMAALIILGISVAYLMYSVYTLKGFAKATTRELDDITNLNSALWRLVQDGEKRKRKAPKGKAKQSKPNPVRVINPTRKATKRKV